MNIYKNKVAIITGAGSGIGRGLAEELARRGAIIVISDINIERIEKAREEMSKNGAKVSALNLDVVDREAVGKMISETKAEFGRIDYMFNNAGIAVAGQVRDISIQDWHNVINVNLFGVINGVDAVYPVMVEQGFGHIVNISSIEGLIPFVSHLPYTTSKYAVVGLSHGLRMEAEPLGVKVSVACPGYIDTPIFNESKMVNLDKEKALKALDGYTLMPPLECAKEILRGVEKNKDVIVVSALAKLAWTVERLAPDLLRLIMKREMQPLFEARIKDREKK